MWLTLPDFDSLTQDWLYLEVLAVRSHRHSLERIQHIRKNTVSFCNIKSTSCITNTSQSSHMYIAIYYQKTSAYFFETQSTSCVIKSNKYL